MWPSASMTARSRKAMPRLMSLAAPPGVKKVRMPDGSRRRDRREFTWRRRAADYRTCAMHPTPKALFLLVGLLIFATPALAGDAATGFVDTLVEDGLSQPTALAFLPDGRLLIAEKGGALKLNDGVNTSTLITIGVCDGSEMG